MAVAAGMLKGMMEHRFPVVLGKDFAGVVEALGEGASLFAPGDDVFGVVMKPFLGDGGRASISWSVSSTGTSPGFPTASTCRPPERWAWPAWPGATRSTRLRRRQASSF